MHYSLQCSSREEKWKKWRGKAEAAPKAKGCHLNFIIEGETKTPLCPSKLLSETQNLKKIQTYVVWALGPVGLCISHHLQWCTRTTKVKWSFYSTAAQCMGCICPTVCHSILSGVDSLLRDTYKLKTDVHHSHRKTGLKSLPTPASCPMWWQTKERHYMQATKHLYVCREVAKVEKIVRNYLEYVNDNYLDNWRLSCIT